MAVLLSVVSIGVAIATAQQDGDAEQTRGSAAEPFSIGAVRQWDHACTVNWFMPVSQGEFDFAPADGAPWTENPDTERGFPASPSWVTFNLQGLSEVDVTILSIKVEVTKRRPAPVGVVLDAPCGDAGPYQWLEAHLDEEPARTYTAGDTQDRLTDDPSSLDMAPVRFPYVISSSQSERYLVSAWTVDCDCDWHIVVEWESLGRQGEHVIDDSGRPFRTVGLARAASECLPRGECTAVPDISLTPRSDYADYLVPIP